MVRHKLKDPKTIVCIILVSLGFPAMVVLFTLGGVFFSKEHPKVLNYANDTCQVESNSYKIYQCHSRSGRYTCYGPIWHVHHGENRTIFAIVEEEKRYLYSSDALKKAYEYQINATYSCWYDTRNPAVVHWEKPDILVAIILLACGGSLVVLIGLLLFLGFRFIKQEILQNEHCDIDPYSTSDPYIKQ